MTEGGYLQKGEIEKVLSDKGKESLFDAIEKYIEIEIEWKTGNLQGYNQNDLKKAKRRFLKARNNLELKLKSLKMVINE